MRNMLKNNKAITLIALIITIVILIILAGVVISLSLGNNGLFNKAQEAKEKYLNAQDYEETELGKIDNKINSYVSGTRDEELEGAKMRLLLSIQSTENNGKNVGTYDVSTFDQTSDTLYTQANNYIQYDSTNKCYIAKVSGWYIFDLEASSKQDSNYTNVDLNLFLDDTKITNVSSISNGGGAANKNGKMLTVYISQNSTFTFNKVVHGNNNDSWNTCGVKVWLLK